MTVRLASSADHITLARLRWEWRTGEGGEAGMGEAEFVAALSDWLVGHEESHFGWLAEHEGKPVGMAWLAVVRRVPGPGRWERLAGYLQSVYVSPRHRGRGIGASLVEAVIDDARSRGLDYLAVHPSKKSFSLYRRAGFVESGRVLELDLRADR